MLLDGIDVRAKNRTQSGSGSIPAAGTSIQAASSAGPLHVNEVAAVVEHWTFTLCTTCTVPVGNMYKQAYLLNIHKLCQLSCCLAAAVVSC
jgi:hypothetical protein